MKHLYSVIPFILFCLFASAQTNNDRELNAQKSPLQHLSAEQYQAYQQGTDVWGMGLVANLNHYPSPQQILDLKKELSIDKQQEVALVDILSKLNFKVKEMGTFIIKNERMMDSLFRLKKVNDGLLIYYTNRYGLYQGELRNAILQAHLKTKTLLKSSQLRKYERLLKR